MIARRLSPDRPAVTVNPCRLCAPLGASLVFKGIEGGMSLLHGSQGCSTYIRRYLISHFREPVDIASSNFSEASAVFGGKSNLYDAIDAVVARYHPQVLGIATTCLAETIGDDVPGLLRGWQAERGGPDAPVLINVSTPSYRGGHLDGWRDTVVAVAEALAEGGEPLAQVNLLPPMLSPADLRELSALCAALGLPAVLLPDYSDTLDGVSARDYQPIPPGGTPLARLRSLGRSRATLHLGGCGGTPAATALERRHGVPLRRLPLPIGCAATDALIAELARLSGLPVPADIAAQRGRLLDQYVDGHKYVAGRRVAVVGDDDLALALAAFCAEVGCRVELIATGAVGSTLPAAVAAQPALAGAQVMIDSDHAAIAARLGELKPEVVLGPSKVGPACRAHGIALLRCGFPVHDRLGAQRLLHVGYRGAQRLFDDLVNLLLDRAQSASPVGYAYQ